MLFLLYYFKDNYINNWRTRHFLNFAINFALKKKLFSCYFHDSKNRSRFGFRSGFVYMCSSVICILRIRYLTNFVSLRLAHSLTQQWTILFFCFCPQCNNNKQWRIQDLQTGEARLSAIGTSIEVPREVECGEGSPVPQRVWGEIFLTLNLKMSTYWCILSASFCSSAPYYTSKKHCFWIIKLAAAACMHAQHGDRQSRVGMPPPRPRAGSATDNKYINKTKHEQLTGKKRE